MMEKSLAAILPDAAEGGLAFSLLQIVGKSYDRGCFMEAESMSSQSRDDRWDGISAGRMPSEPPAFESRRRSERDDDEHEPRRGDSFPLALVLVLGGVGLLMIMLVVGGVFFWLAFEAAPEPMAVAPPMAVDVQEERVWVQNDFAREPDRPPWVDQLLPFQEKPIELFREPFRAEGRLTTIDLKDKINWRRDEAIDLGGNDLGDMPMGESEFAGIKFNVQGGAILLGGRP